MQTTLTLSGSGYTLAISPEAEKRKAELLALSARVITVTTPEEAAAAKNQITETARFLREVERSREAVKAPGLEFCRSVDATAKEFVATLKADSDRIAGAIRTFELEAERKRRAAAAEAQRLAEEARKLKEDADRKLREAEAAKVVASSPFLSALQDKPVDVVEKIHQAREADNLFAETATAFQSAAIASVAPVTKGTKVVADFRVVDIRKLYEASPAMVEITVRRRELLGHINALLSTGASIESIRHAIPGIEVIEDIKISRR